VADNEAPSDPSASEADASGVGGSEALSGDDASSAFTDRPKRGSGLGGIIGAILRGLEPAIRRTVRRRGAGSSASGGGRGALLALRYHDRGADRWGTARVAFGRRGNRIAVISSSDAGWWRHIRSGSPVQVRIRNQWVDGHARLLARDEDTYARAVGIFIEDRSRAAARRLGVPMDEQGRLERGERRSGDAVVVWIEVDAS
jgi:hypothetical protein